MSNIYRDEAWLRERYVTEGLCDQEIAEIAGCTDVCISQWRRRLGIPTRGRAPSLDETVHSREWLYEQYAVQGRSIKAIAQEQSCACSVVGYWLRNLGVPIRAQVAPDQYDVTAGWLEEQYLEKMVSVREIAEMIGCAEWTVYNRLDRFNISKRTTGESLSLAHSRGVGSFGTDEYRRKLSLTKRGELNPAWLGGKTAETRPRECSDYQEWRESVLSRDAYICQSCFAVGWVAHHLMGYAAHPEMGTDVDNGITLCSRCHYAFHSVYGNNCTRVQFEEFQAIVPVGVLG